MLGQRQYAATSIRGYLREAVAFSRWVAGQRYPVSDLTEHQLNRYLRACAPVTRRRRQKICRGVHFLFVHLRARAVIVPPPESGCPVTAVANSVRLIFCSRGVASDQYM